MARRPDAQELTGRSSRRSADEKPSAFDNFRWSRVVLWAFSLGSSSLSTPKFDPASSQR